MSTSNLKICRISLRDIIGKTKERCQLYVANNLGTCDSLNPITWDNKIQQLYLHNIETNKLLHGLREKPGSPSTLRQPVFPQDAESQII